MLRKVSFYRTYEGLKQRINEAEGADRRTGFYRTYEGLKLLIKLMDTMRSKFLSYL